GADRQLRRAQPGLEPGRSAGTHALSVRPVNDSSSGAAVTDFPSDSAHPGAVPPPGCPAHGSADGIARLYGPTVEADPAGLFETLREQHGPVAPVLLEGDVPAWLVLGYRENMEVARTPTRFSRDSRNWR